ncbi:hypothetical protein DNTS_009907 [Danionella cerebrum]|uniref:Uncharacterized protein n=1 Tax=Danionella cerebrum TaxID=2873325 RepID=A0A553RDQ1_9TELE|nr:hypothetical protein DNTS_009907 [Danionella translucida]
MPYPCDPRAGKADGVMGGRERETRRFRLVWRDQVPWTSDPDKPHEKDPWGRSLKLFSQLEGPHPTLSTSSQPIQYVSSPAIEVD